MFDPKRYLPIHHDRVSLLPPEPTALAELHQALTLIQRLFR